MSNEAEQGLRPSRLVNLIVELLHILNEEDMTSAVSTDLAPQGSTTSQRDRWHEQRHIVQQVAAAYEQLSSLPALAAHNIDPFPQSRSLTRTCQSIEYGADVEHAVRYAIRNRPDAAALMHAWKRLCSDPNVIGEAERRFIQRAGPIFAARGLHPKQYFVHIHRKVGEKLT